MGAYSGSSAITVPDGVLRVPSAAICFDLESHVLGTCEPQRLCVVLGACRKRRCGRGTEMTGTSERGGRPVQFGSYRAADRSKGGPATHSETVRVHVVRHGELASGKNWKVLVLYRERKGESRMNSDLKLRCEFGNELETEEERLPGFSWPKRLVVARQCAGP